MALFEFVKCCWNFQMSHRKRILYYLSWPRSPKRSNDAVDKEPGEEDLWTRHRHSAHLRFICKVRKLDPADTERLAVSLQRYTGTVVVYVLHNILGLDVVMQGSEGKSPSNIGINLSTWLVDPALVDRRSRLSLQHFGSAPP